MGVNITKGYCARCSFAIEQHYPHVAVKLDTSKEYCSELLCVNCFLQEVPRWFRNIMLRYKAVEYFNLEDDE